MTDPPQDGKASAGDVTVSAYESGEALNSLTSIELIDEAALAACGYKQEFKREFGLFSTFSVSFSVLGILPSVASTLSYGLGYAGTAGLTWAWVICAIGIQAVATSMAELSSSMPTSGGLYYCVGVLAPPAWAPFLSYLTGWSNWLGAVSAAPSVNYGNAAMINALMTLNNPDYVTSNPKTLFVYSISDSLDFHSGICVALTFLCFICAALPTRYVAKLNSYGTGLQLICLIIVMVGLPAASKNTPRFASNRQVWGVIDNQTDWPNGIAILMSFLTAIWTMSGYDAPFHLSEECSNAQIATPRAIVATSAMGGVLGWFLCLAISYTIVDINGVLTSDLGQTFIAVLDQVLTPRTATAFGALTILCGVFCAQGCAIPASRLGVRLRPGWIAARQQHRRARQPPNQDPHQRVHFQLHRASFDALPDLCGTRGHRRHLFHRCGRGVLRLHLARYVAVFLRRRQVASRTLAPRPLEQAVWLPLHRLRLPHDPHPLPSRRQGRRPYAPHDELDRCRLGRSPLPRLRLLRGPRPQDVHRASNQHRALEVPGRCDLDAGRAEGVHEEGRCRRLRRLRLSPPPFFILCFWIMCFPSLSMFGLSRSASSLPSRF